MSGAIAHGGAIGAAIARFGGAKSDWLDLSTGLNPCPPDLPALDSAAWHRLPDRELFDQAETAAARFYGTVGMRPLAVAGTQAAIQQLPGLVQPGRRVAIVSPTYGEYGRVFAEAGFAMDRIAALADVTADHRLVVVVNPNNPDGRTYRPDALAALAGQMADRGALLVVDEAFADCTPGISLAPVVHDHPNLLVFRSFGKFFGMAGIRIGFVLAGDALRQALETTLGPWAVSGPALCVAARLMTGDTSAIHRAIAARKAAQMDILHANGLQPLGGTSLFALVESNRAAQLHDHLCRRHILTRVFDYAPTWLRLGLCPDRAADARLGVALAAFGDR